MDNRFNPIKNLIDGEGRFIGTIHEKEEAILKAQPGRAE